MTSPEQCRLEPAQVAALYVEHADELRAFLWGVLRDTERVADVLQATFVKAIESGHAVDEGSLKAWLFQVAYREALALRRRLGVESRAADRLAESTPPASELPELVAVRRELVERVQAALSQLPAAQSRVVELRIYEQMKFADIAQQLNVPLGTVLTRMQTALAKLRSALSR